MARDIVSRRRRPMGATPDPIDAAIEATKAPREEPAPPPPPTVSDVLQAVLDGPSDGNNARTFPEGEHALDRPLVIRRWRTKLVRRDKWGRDLWSIVPPVGQPAFVFEYVGPVPGARASIVYADDPDTEVTG